MKQRIVLLLLLLVLVGCSPKEEPVSTVSAVSGNQDLMFTQEDLTSLGIQGDEISCLTEKYETGEYSSLAEYSFCNYTITSLNNTEVLIQLSKFTNKNDRDGAYQYDSSHLRSSDGIISRDEYGEQSTFSKNSVNDYGGQFNDPDVHYYHLWIVKEDYLIHITSKGSIDAKEYIAKMGEQYIAKVV
jgi:hypothetical protein